MAFCMKCGAQMTDSDKFCMQCGSPRTEQPVVEVPVTEPVVEAPVMEPVVEAPVMEPVVEAPVIEPVEEASVAESSIVDTPVVESAEEAPTTEPEVEEMVQPEPQVMEIPSAEENIQPVFQTETPAQPVFQAEIPAQPVFQGEVPAQPVFSAIPQEPKKKSKGPIIAIISAAVVALIGIIVAIVLLLMPSVEELDLSKYITVEYDGYDSTGTADVYLDKTKLLIGILDAQGEDTKSVSSSKLSLSLNALINSIEIEVSSVDNSLDSLSNGDKIIVTVKYDELLMEENDLEFTNAKKEYTVKGLVELEEIDPFEDVTVEFSGTSPNGYANYSRGSDIDCVRWATMEFDNNSDLRNGDVVTLSIDPASVDNAVKEGYKFAVTSKEYTVEGLDYYYESLDQISDEHMAEFKEKADKEIEDEISWLYNMAMTDIQNIGTYFAKAEDYPSNSYIIFVYTATLTSEDGKFPTSQIYIPVKVSGMLVEDGELDYISAFSEGYMSIEGSYTSVRGYVSGDVMYTESIMNLIDDDYEITASDDMPEFKETTDENILKQSTQAPTTEGETTPTTEGESTTPAAAEGSN
ncbi:MAG: zinc-ribbon domain-containing protein [Lachnospiraceae bacterium]|nr:zinc-ribbon domain-containing protein [Lachnospiraceae bacterium]